MSNSYKRRHIVRILRRLPARFPGKLRLARPLLQPLFDLKDITIHDKYGFCYKVPNIREPIGFHLLINGVYEPVLMDLLLRYVKPGFTFIDIGANIGTFSIAMAKAVGPRGSVIAIEPSPTIFPYLRENIQLNNISNIETRNCAVGEVSGSLPFYDAPITHFGMGSFAPQFHSNPVDVPVNTLGNILSKQDIDQIDIIKTDVEGYEYFVFKGAPQLLTRTRKPLIIFEFCDWAEKRISGINVGDSQRILRAYGYKIYRLHDFTNKKPLKKILLKGSDTLIAES